MSNEFVKKISRDEFLDDLKKLEVPVGAHLIIWGAGTFVSFIITWLQYFWLGVKNSPTHIQRAYDKNRDISAEWNGVKLVHRIKKLSKVKRVKIVFHKKYLDSGVKKKFSEVCEKYINAPYDYYFYFLVTLRIFLLFLVLAFIWTLIINAFFITLLMIIVIILYWPVRRFLKNKSKRSWACAELSNVLDRDMGIDTGIDINHNTSPLYYYRLSRASSDFETLYDSGNISRKKQV